MVRITPLIILKIDFLLYVFMYLTKVSTRRSLASSAAPDRPGMGLPRQESLANPSWLVPNSLGQSNPNTTQL